MTMPKPKSRPRCSACYGARKIYDPWIDEVLECVTCEGTGYDPYYTGKEEDNEHASRE